MNILLTCICDKELDVEYSNDSELSTLINEAIRDGWNRLDGKFSPEATAEIRTAELESVIAEAVAATLGDCLNLEWRCPKHARLR